MCPPQLCSFRATLDSFCFRDYPVEARVRYMSLGRWKDKHVQRIHLYQLVLLMQRWHITGREKIERAG